VVRLVAMLPQEQPLRHELDAFRLPAPFRVVRHAPALGVHGHSFVTGGGDQVQLGGQPEVFRAEADRTRDPGWLVAGFFGGGFPLGIREHVVQTVDTAVRVPALHRVHVVRPPAIDVHEVEEPRAVGILVEHADGEEVCIA